MPRPVDDPFEWASDTNFVAPTLPWNATPTKVDPPSALQQTGFVPGDAATAQHLNALLARKAEWLQYLANQTADPDTWMLHTGVTRDARISASEAERSVSSSGPYWTLDSGLAAPDIHSLRIDEAGAGRIFWVPRGFETRGNPMYDDLFVPITLIASGTINITIEAQRLVADADPTIDGVWTKSVIHTIPNVGVGVNAYTPSVTYPSGGALRAYNGGGFGIRVSAVGNPGSYCVASFRNLRASIISSGPRDI